MDPAKSLASSSRPAPTSYGPLSALYFDLTKPPGEAYPDVGYFKQRIQERGGRALVLGSGAGRLLLPLCTSGLDVEGVECAEAMRDRCTARAERLRVSPRVYAARMESFRAPGNYSAIVVPFGNLQLLPTDEAIDETLARCRENLAPQGRLYVTSHVPYEAMQHPEETALTRPTVTAPDGSRITLEAIRRVDLFAQVVHQENRYHCIRNAQVVASEVEVLHVRWFGVRELQLQIERAGFHVIDVVGDFGEEPPAAHHQMICYTATPR